MMRIEHKFREHAIQSDTKILMVGTFNPDVEGNGATFFYGRELNDLWDLLPTTLGEANLKNATLSLKKDFMLRCKVDFVDMIKALDGVPEHEALNYDDAYIDPMATDWFDVIDLLKAHPSIQEVYLTRKTFNTRVPALRKHAKAIKDHCGSRIRCAGLITPSRMYRNMTHKRDQWRGTMVTRQLTEFTGI